MSPRTSRNAGRSCRRIAWVKVSGSAKPSVRPVDNRPLIEATPLCWRQRRTAASVRAGITTVRRERFVFNRLSTSTPDSALIPVVTRNHLVSSSIIVDLTAKISPRRNPQSSPIKTANAHGSSSTCSARPRCQHIGLLGAERGQVVIAVISWTGDHDSITDRVRPQQIVVHCGARDRFPAAAPRVTSHDSGAARPA